MSRQTTWTVLAVGKDGTVKTTRDLTLRETAYVLDSLKRDNSIADMPRSPWPRIARQKAQEITADEKFTTSFERAFSLRSIKDHRPYHCWYSNGGISKVEVWSNDGTEILDVWPAPDDLVEHIVYQGNRIIDRRRRLCEQLIKWFDIYSKIPFAKRPNFVFEDDAFVREIYEVKP